MHGCVSDEAASHSKSLVAMRTFVMFHMSPNVVDELPPQFKTLPAGFASEQSIIRLLYRLHICVRCGGGLVVCVFNSNV